MLHAHAGRRGREQTETLKAIIHITEQPAVDMPLGEAGWLFQGQAIVRRRLDQRIGLGDTDRNGPLLFVTAWTMADQMGPAPGQSSRHRAGPASNGIEQQANEAVRELRLEPGRLRRHDVRSGAILQRQGHLPAGAAMLQVAHQLPGVA